MAPKFEIVNSSNRSVHSAKWFRLTDKYDFVENKNLRKLLLAIDVPEHHIETAVENRDGVEVKVDGNKITLLNEGPLGVTNVVVGEEYDEKTSNGQNLKCFATLEGGILTIKASEDGKPAYTRTFTFTDGGYQVTTVVVKDGKTHSATRIFKRA